MIKKVFSIAFALLISCSAFQASAQTKYFSGIYTIGGNNANYQNLQKALIDLLDTKSEVIGRVTFNIRPGTYTEVLNLKPYKGASAKNFVVFKSETGKASDVVISNVGDNTLYNNHVIRFEGCSYYTFQDLTIENKRVITASNQFASAIHFTYNRDSRKPAEYNTINRCIIKVDSNYTVFNGNTYPIVFSDINNTSMGEKCASYNTISNNSIYGGFFGIRLLGKSSGDPSKGNRITGNKFYKCLSGIDVENNNIPLISFNQIYCRVNPNGAQYGIRVRNASGNFAFHGNIIKDFGTFGIFLGNIQAGSAGYVYNNMILGQSKPSYSRAIHIEYSRLVQFFHNSIYFTAPKTTDNACLVIDNTNTKISSKNNIFFTSGGAHPVIIPNPGVMDTSNYNVYFNASGNNLAYISNLERAGIGAVRTAMSKDGQSQNVNPQFASPTSLRINSKFLIRKAAVLSFVTVDFENQPRDPETPDIGADEVIRSAVDLEVFHLEKNFVPKQGSNTLPVVIKNDGLLSLNGNKIMLSYSVNNGAYTTPEEFTLQTLSKPYSKQIVTLATPWVIPSPGLYTLILRVTPPVPNDTWQVNDADTLSICVGIDGNYTIGGPAGPKNYPTFAAAIAAFECGVGGPTVFDVYPGTYPSFSIPNLKGASDVNTLTFRSQTGNPADVIIQNSTASQNNNNHYTIQVDNAGYVIFKNLTVVNTSANNYASGFHITEGANNIIIDSCIITVPTTNNASAFIYPVVMSQKIKIDSGAVYTNVYIKNSTLKNGVAGIQMFGRNTEVRAQNNGAINNNIDSAILYGISTNFVNVGEISKNNITLKSTSTVLSEAIRIVVSKYNTIISSNKTSNAGFRGLNLTSVEGVTGVTIANNMFAGGFKTTGNGAGIYFNEVNKINLYHNSVYYDATATVIPNNSSAFFISSGSNVSLFNNIFYNPAGGYAFFVTSPTSIRASNNNIYYTDADPSQGLYAFWNSADRLSMAALRSAMVAFESKSLELNPNFISNKDLHTNNINLEGKGLYLENVNKDFDNQDRNPLGPDIGADEFIIHAKDLAVMDINPIVFSTGTNTIKIKLINLGSNSLNGSTIKLQYSSDGVTWQPAGGESYTIGAGGNASLQNPYSSAIYSFATPFNAVVNNSYSFSVRIMPSDKIVGDGVSSNDTSSLVICTGLNGGSYTIGGSSPSFVDFTSAMSAISCGITGPVVFNVRPGTYNERFTIGNPKNTSAINTITIKAENNDSSSVIINSTGTATNTTRNTIRMNRSKFINLKYLTIQNLSVSIVGAAAIQITSESNNINISNCRILLDSNTTSPNIMGITTSDSANIALGGRGGSNIRIFKNYIFGGNISIAIKGANQYSREASIMIDSNAIINPATFGILSSNADILSIDGNKVEMRKGLLSSTGLSITVNKEDSRIVNNVIYNAATTGVIFDDVVPVNGILFANNMVGGNFRANAENGVALSLNKVFPMKIYYNSINYDGVSNSGSALKIDNDSRGIRLLNNSIANAGTGYALIFTNQASIDTSENNNYFTKGTIFCKADGIERVSLDEYRDITLTDLKSVSVDPDYFSKTNLHLTNTFLDAGALVLKEVTKDIDGQVRNPDFPDIGADEFHILGDAEIVSIDSPLPSPDIYPDSITVIITVRNKGLSKVSGLNVKYYVDNEEVTNEVIPVEDPYKPLLPSDILTYQFKKGYSPSETGSYLLRVEAYLPDDIDISNNSQEVTFKSSISSIVDGEVSSFVSPANSSVNGKTPIVVLIRNSGTIPIKNFKVNYRIRGGGPIVNDSEFFGSDSILPLESAAFTFSDSIDCNDIYDRFIDVFISDLDDDINQVNDTLMMYIKPFAGCFQSVSVDTKELMLTNPWPNPTSSELNYDVNLYQESDMTIDLVNVLGNIVKTINYSQLSEGVNHLNIDVQDLAPGIYYSRVTVFGKAYTNRVVITR